ncbi:hypothetical protein [Actinoplanes aureus]|uniref:Uncharacterized protein n=1 Tax=Actinoplanes aureus TaxID=2792083 RepID=A0A931C3L3_9ACTN|nr:hypothetical protein [Actinoplanes aureus]MBG0560747.1 hypothetical protein [Actinoplanes aureus]
MGLIAYLRRRWLSTGFTVLLSGSAINIWIQDGGKALIVIAAVSVGLVLVIAAEFLLSGYHVAKHSLVYQHELPRVARGIRALEANRHKESHQ